MEMLFLAFRLLLILVQAKMSVKDIFLLISIR